MNRLEDEVRELKMAMSAYGGGRGGGKQGSLLYYFLIFRGLESFNCLGSGEIYRRDDCQKYK